MKDKIQEELEKGCGKEACGVTVTDGYGTEDCDITECGVYCPHHKEIEYCPTCELKLAQHKQTKQEMIKKFEKMIDEVENPYPLDIFPEIKTEQWAKVQDVLLSKLNISLDRVSASLMRRARKTLKEELKQKIGELKT